MPACEIPCRAWKRWSEPQAPVWKATFKRRPSPGGSRLGGCAAVRGAGSLHPRFLAFLVEPLLPAAAVLVLEAGDLLQRPDHVRPDDDPGVVARLPVLLAGVGAGVGVLRHGLVDLVDEVGDGPLRLGQTEVADAGLTINFWCWPRTVGSMRFASA